MGELQALASSASAWTWLALVVGVVLRLADYGTNRALWMDEEALAESVVGRPILEFDRPLARDQLAPPGFLAMARASDRLIGHSSYALRLMPLAFGIAVLFVARALARRLLAPAAVPIAIGLLAVGDDLIYYSGEFKQYSSDVLIALGCSVLVWDLAVRPFSRARLALATALGSLAFWCSFTAIFVLATAGLWLAGNALVRRDGRRLVWLALMGAVWLVNFGLSYVVSRRLLAPGDWMWIWWGFAFLPLPPRSFADVSHLFWTVANLVTNPAGLDTPFTPIGTGLLGLALALVGATRLGRKRDWGALALCLGPIALAMAVSATRAYPFHGRLILFAAPLVCFLMAEGTATLARPRWWPFLAAIMLAFSIVPVSRFAIAFEKPRGRSFDSHGDQRNDLLDYMELGRTTREHRAGPR